MVETEWAWWSYWMARCRFWQRYIRWLVKHRLDTTDALEGLEIARQALARERAKIQDGGG